MKKTLEVSLRRPINSNFTFVDTLKLNSFNCGVRESAIHTTIDMTTKGNG